MLCKILLPESYENLIPDVRTNINNIHFNGSNGIATGYNSILISSDDGEN